MCSAYLCIAIQNIKLEGINNMNYGEKEIEIRLGVISLR